ncbi:hypothetical protein EST38_g9231 [Candolleomyces aberdarensis]|uniref:Uncharacterized protein n=1 Tax=Candolleomyces aberdarensis TaxID=2316362 RepID=A0A4Q2DAF4_9AGAR|nr:hypothetical protein EST38_g9231 [Candolleomyces aberdarensis]
MRYHLAATFLNEHALPLLHYFQQPGLAEISNGQLLQSVLLKIVDPPIFWNAFQQAFLNNTLTLDSQKAFGWLLLQLISLAPDSSATYREDPYLNQHLRRLLSSGDIDLRTLGHKVKHATEALKSESSTVAAGAVGSTSGGRHDNDFADFRQIAIVPTPDEVQSKEPAFIRPSDFLRDPSTEPTRVASHLDNQFRLLREDMLYDLREELQLALGDRKRRRGTKISGLQVVGLYLQESEPRGKNVHRVKCGLQLECEEDLAIFQGVNPERREKHIRDERYFLRHQSLACLQVENEIIAFVTIHRDTALLAQPWPIIAVQLEGNEGLMKALREIKQSDNLTLIQIDTPLFAYEFVLKALQQAPSLPLSEELLLWKPDSVPQKLKLFEQATPVVNALLSDPDCDLKSLLRTKDHIHLDASQSQSLLVGLVQRVSLIQGPPGTGKSLIGALMAKAIHDYTKQTILVICFTNHALDDILTSLLDIGIPASSMVRLGGKSTSKTEPLTLRHQVNTGPRDKTEWQAINAAKLSLDNLDGKLTSSFAEYMTKTITLKDILGYLKSEDRDYAFAFTVPKGEDDMQIVGRKKGHVIGRTYLLERWLKGQDAGALSSSENVRLGSGIWDMSPAERNVKYREWYDAVETKQVQGLYSTIKSYNKQFENLEQAFASKDISVLRGKRIIGCTTTAAAKFGFSIQAAAPNVVLVEEAGEILESHILTALSPNLSQLILIGDHKQLRPKVNNYELTVEKNNGYDLNCSLFERLILSGYPHQTLMKQHRMRPEISDLIRQLTYPELQDATRTQNRPNISGVQDNIVFISHSKPEGNHGQLTDRKDMASKASKQNPFEVEMVLKIVKYLGQQGYGTDNLVVLTPYLGQLHRLRDALKKDNDPLLSDLDSYELVKAGLLSPATAKENKKPIRLSTIDNFQGEESDIVIISLTRSNSSNDIGFMYSPERLNVLLSRARNGLIMIGNSSTFKNSRKGKEVWTKLFNMLAEGEHIYEGLPVYCARHPDRKQILCKAEDFDEKCPDGGCIEPCDTMLNCQVHRCTSRCHNIVDHSKIPCEELVSGKCLWGHPLPRKCHELPVPGACKTCDREDKRIKKKQLADLKERERKEAAELKHLQEMAEIDAEIDKQRQKKEAKEAEERAQAILQRRAHLVALKARTGIPVGYMSTPQNVEPPQTEPPQRPSFEVLDKLTSFASGGGYINAGPRIQFVPSGENASTRGGREGSQQQRRNVQPGPPESPHRATPVAPISASSSWALTPAPPNSQSRRPGMSDETRMWLQLQAERRQAEEDERRKRDKRLEKAKREAEAQRRQAEELARQAAQAQEEARLKQLKYQRRQAEEDERRLRAERERIAELERKEQADQQRLRQMGVCVSGHQWIKQYLLVTTHFASMAEEPDYEALPANAGLAVNMLAGALAGISEHAVMFPIDSIKTRMQVFATSPVAVYSGVGNAFTRISATEGMRALWRGVSSVALGAGPAHALHFGTLEAVKELAGGNEAGNQVLATSLAGASATIVSDAFMNPFDVIKQRMQLHKSEYRSLLTCARSIYRTEGLAAFYISYPTTLAISIPFNAIQFTVYEHIKRYLNPRGEYSPGSHIVAGGIAGAVAAGVTTPLDVAKTILQTRGSATDPEIRSVRGMGDALKIIWKKDGLRGFSRGMTPRILTVMPSTALCWLSYEFFKAAIRSD